MQISKDIETGTFPAIKSGLAFGESLVALKYTAIMNRNTSLGTEQLPLRVTAYFPLPYSLSQCILMPPRTRKDQVNYPEAILF